MEIICTNESQFESAAQFEVAKQKVKTHKRFCKALNRAEREIKRLHKEHLKFRHRVWFDDADTEDTPRIAESCEAHWKETESAIAEQNALIAAAFATHATAVALKPRDCRLRLYPYTSEAQFHDKATRHTYEQLPKTFRIGGESYPRLSAASRITYASRESLVVYTPSLTFTVTRPSVVGTVELFDRTSFECKSVQRFEGAKTTARIVDGKLELEPVPTTELVNGRYQDTRVCRLPTARISVCKEELRVYNPVNGKLVVVSLKGKDVESTMIHAKWFYVPAADGRLHLRIGKKLFISIAYDQFY